MTIDELIAQLRGQMATKLAQRNGHAEELSNLRSAGTTDGSKVDELRGKKVSLDAELDQMTARVVELEREKASDEAADRLTREVNPGAPRPVYGDSARVGAEARTYNPETDKTGKKFLRDFMAVQAHGSFGARAQHERLARHMEEEAVERAQYLDRAAGTGAFAGLTIPQYLTDLYAPAVANLSPFANMCTPHDLPPEGMTVTISRITTGSDADLQASENTGVTEQDMDDTLLNINVQTVGGQQTLSQQAVQRGTGIEDITLKDLVARYRTRIDKTMIQQATNGLSAIAQAVAYTDASPTAAELYPKILNGNANVETALLGEGYATHVIMHSRRWNWLQSQVGSTWPAFAQPNIPTQAQGVNLGGGYSNGVRGMLPNGLLVIVDNNIATNLGAGTNEDEIYVVPQSECHLWQDPNAPLFIRTEATKAASLGVLLVVYGFFAYTLGRYTNGMSKVGGTGLVTPTF